MLTLYHNNMSSCSQKVRYMLAARQVDWKSIEFNLREGNQHDPAYLKLNPNGVVPTLVVDGVPVIESGIICEYVNALGSGHNYVPDAPLSAALMRNWVRFIDDKIHAEAGVVSTALAFRHTLLAKGDDVARAKINAIPNPAKRERMMSVNFEGVQSPLFRTCIEAFRGMLRRMEVDLNTNTYLVGPTPSVADVVVLPYLVRLEHLNLSDMWVDLPATANWFAGMKESDAFVPALRDWFDAPVVAQMQSRGAEAWPEVAKLLA